MGSRGLAVPVEFPPLPALDPGGRYPIIYADPPWDYKGQLQHSGPGSGDSGGAIRHYNTLRLQDLMELDVASIAAADSLLFLWATSPHLDQAVGLGNAWAFEWATVAFVWDKQRVNPGFYTMSQCELCLVFKRGRIPAPRGARNVRQLVSEPRAEHSRKPAEVRRRIEAMFPEQRKIELFARDTDIPGWDTWGEEISHPQTERRFRKQTQEAAGS
ncbi:MAG: transcriptional regulator [Chloroflexi bacterium]|nr:transcriptional regulator [Chloroflexota bacterium]MYF81953.1 transcriptional regulator [Chloroflexota bacterium]MYI04613.1 transcriptional regulator [Chloroflexota bacterium]